MEDPSCCQERVRPARAVEVPQGGRKRSSRSVFAAIACASVLVIASWNAFRSEEPAGHQDFLLQKGRLKHYVQLKERLLRSVLGKSESVRSAMLVKSQILADLLGKSKNGGTERDEPEGMNTEATAGIHEKARILNDMLQKEIFNLDSPQVTKDTENADIDSEIANVKHLAHKQHVPLPPLAPDSKYVLGEGVLTARIEGEAVDILTGKTIPNVLVQLVGENDKLQPNEIEKESLIIEKDEPLHPGISRVLRSIAKGFQAVGMTEANEGISGSPVPALYSTMTDNDGKYILIGAPAIYSVRVFAEKDGYDPAESEQHTAIPGNPVTIRLLMNPYLPVGEIRFVLAWGRRWWDPRAPLVSLELQVLTMQSAVGVASWGGAEPGTRPQPGDREDEEACALTCSDQVCDEEKKRERVEADDIDDGGPLTIALEKLMEGRYWVSVELKESQAGEEENAGD
eukprot:56532-Hanusia_phi.AAC.3